MRTNRMLFIYFAMILMFVALAARLVGLTNAMTPSAAINTHGTYTLKLDCGRGTIYDTNHKPIVNATSEYVAFVTPSSTAYKKLEPHVKDKATLRKKIKQGKPFMITVDSQNINATGVTIVKRQYRYSEPEAVAPHIIGYIDATGSGKSGIEKAYDSVLQKYSCKVAETYDVDAKNRVLDGIAPEFSKTGDDTGGVELALDRDIQISAQKAADKYMKTGAIIVMDVKTGDILACVSSPAYSPDSLGSALKGENSPLLNRALAAYDLGSVFKIAVTASALEAGVDPSFTVNCTGEIQVGDHLFHCEKRSGHGTENMQQGFENSCNPYFITLGRRLAHRIYSEWPTV